MTHRPTGEAEGVCLGPRRRLRRWNKARRAAFLDALADTCNVSAAARKAGMDRSSAYHLKDRDLAFAKGWGIALERAHTALEWRLLELSNDGSVRTELVIDPESEKPKQIKLIHSYPLTTAVRLFLSHRAEVASVRLAQAGLETDEEIRARVFKRMDEIRARLLAPDPTGMADKPGRPPDMPDGDGATRERTDGAAG